MTTTCAVVNTASFSFMAGRYYCSLAPGHEGQHIAYRNNNVTNHGSDVIWLGPWEDNRSYLGPETDRLQREWDKRD